MQSETQTSDDLRSDHQAFLLLGSNLGDRRKNLNEAIHHLRQHVGHVDLVSSIYETEPWGLSDGPSFFNQAVQITTELSPNQLMTACLSIESKMGRVRRKYTANRPIDIDILLYEDRIIRQKKCTIPHPRLHLRKFAMIPLLELNTELVHPEFKISIRELLEKCTDQLEVTKLEKNTIKT